MKKLYTVKEVADLLGFSTNSVYKYLDEGKIKSTRLGKGGRFRIPSGEVNRLLQKEKGEVISNLIPVKLLKLASNLKAVPSLCDWFVAIFALALGLSQFIFPNYFSDTTFVRYLLVIKYLKVALLGVGGVLIVLGVIGWQKKVWM